MRVKRGFALSTAGLLACIACGSAASSGGPIDPTRADAAGTSAESGAGPEAGTRGAGCDAFDFAATPTAFSLPSDVTGFVQVNSVLIDAPGVVCPADDRRFQSHARTQAQPTPPRTSPET
jgi:hypothetical protein